MKKKKIISAISSFLTFSMLMSGGTFAREAKTPGKLVRTNGEVLTKKVDYSRKLAQDNGKKVNKRRKKRKGNIKKNKLKGRDFIAELGDRDFVKWMRNHKKLLLPPGCVLGYAAVLKFYRSFRYHPFLDPVTEENLKSEFQIHFINVGQGDCALVRYKEKCWLIDAGYNINFGITDVTKYLPEVGIKEKLDGMILTHPHPDHYWNLKYVLKRFKPEKFYYSYLSDPVGIIDRMNTLQYDSRVTKPLEDFRKDNGENSCKQLLAGEEVFTSENKEFSVTCIGPQKKSDNTNDNSIVLLIKYKDKKILMMGDAEVQSEKEILKYTEEYKIDISNVDVVKIGHHGNNSASSPDFVKHTNPNTIVNSTGGHFALLGLINLHEQPWIIRRWINGDHRSKGNKCKVLTTEEQNNIIMYYDSNSNELKYARK